MSLEEQSSMLSAEQIQAVQEETREAMATYSNPVQQSLGDLNHSEDNSNFFGMEINNGWRIVGEVGLAAFSYAISRNIEQEWVAGAGYSITQGSRAAIGIARNPLRLKAPNSQSKRIKNPDGSESIVTSGPIVGETYIISGENITRKSNKDPNIAARKTAYALKAVGVGIFSLILSIPSSDNAVETTIETNDTNIQDTETQTTVTSVIDSEPANEAILDYSCNIVTPIPPVEPENIIAEEKQAYIDDVMTYQKLLKSASFYDGPIDGIAGSQTQQGTLNLKIKLAQSGIENLTNSSILTTSDCLIFNENGVWDALINIYAGSGE